MTMIKAYYHDIFHELNDTPINKIPNGHSATRNQYAASSQYAASLEKRCQFVRIHPVTHTLLHIHGFLIDEWKF